jgi:flagellar hook-associated protein 2
MSTTSTTTTPTAVSISSSGAISSLGIGSNGINTASIVSQLTAIESQPITQLQRQVAGIQTKISDWGTIQSNLADFQDAANALIDPSTWSTRSTSSNNTAAVTATSTTGAQVGNYNVTVNKLAQAQTNFSAGISSGTALGSAGTLSIQLGQWTGSSFAAGSANAISVTVGATDTLSTIASNINAANAGVSASVVTSNGQDQLILRGTATGAAAGFEITATDSGGNAVTGSAGLGQLTYQPGGTGTTGMSQAQAAQDASATVDGVTVTSANNQITGAISGVTLNLLQASTNPVQISVTNDTSTATSYINKLASTYNTLIGTLSSLTAYNSATNTAGDLQGDASAVGLLNTLKGITGHTGPAGNTFKYLSDLGVQIQLDGTLTVNSSKLASSLANPSAVESLFNAASTGSSNAGLAQQFAAYALSANDTNGIITTRTHSLKQQVATKDSQISTLQLQVSAYQANLTAQYNALDTELATLSTQNSFITQQIAQWNKTTA